MKWLKVGNWFLGGILLLFLIASMIMWSEKDVSTENKVTVPGTYKQKQGQ